jgi:hypothetical protein
MRAAALGWVMKVVVWPSLVEMSICWSIMALLLACGSPVSCLGKRYDCKETAA